MSDRSVKQFDDRTLLGGSPGRVIRLSPAGAKAWSDLQEAPVRSGASGGLARRLIDAGLAHPRPPRVTEALDVTVVVPVRDRPLLLGRCLAALGRSHPVVVVDDGSLEAQAIAEVAGHHGATLIRRADCGGPGAARNTGLDTIGSELIALVDSDCVPPAGWIERLGGHFADPMVAAVAPRIIPVSRTTPLGRYSAACGCLDLGPRESAVAPNTRISYVPSAALLVRRQALEEVSTWPDVFDTALRYGEDVDLIWRLHHGGWRVRYDPAVQVAHHEPDTWTGLLVRRFRYGTSAASLAVRHPGAMAPLVLSPWPTMTAAGLLSLRPLTAGVGLVATTVNTARTLRRGGLPGRAVIPASITAAGRTWLGIARYANQFAAPGLIALMVVPGGSRRRPRRARRVAVASVLLGPPLTAWVSRRPALGPIRFAVAHTCDSFAYGAGVLVGCARTGTARPVIPTISPPVRAGSLRSATGTADRPPRTHERLT